MRNNFSARSTHPWRSGRRRKGFNSEKAVAGLNLVDYKEETQLSLILSGAFLPARVGVASFLFLSAGGQPN